MQITESILKKILVATDLISGKDFSLAKIKAKEKNQPLEEILKEEDLISDEELGELIADEIGFPFLNLREVKINREVLNIIPEIVAKKQEIIVFEKTKEELKVALTHPENLEIREFIERKTGQTVVPYFATKQDVKEALKYYRKEIKEEFEKIIGKTLEEFETIKTEEQSLPVIKMFDLILSYGYENRASDIHIEPSSKNTVLRYRIDGILHDVLTLPKALHNFLISRIKVLASLRTDIHEAAQDGHFSFSAEKEKFDVRVSVVPIEEGEKVVMRLLSEKAKRFNLEELGLASDNLKLVKKNLKQSWGMILSAGPTGCGKTTTLYAMLEILNTREVNIMTIEDPIEYDIEGVNQIQVNLKTKLTFSQGLRSIVRQDPNIIMVGEIRDSETANLATNASLTGHLVLSTFHSIDAGSVLTRLQDMKIEPFVVASTINIVIAQRLVRKICPKCIESYEIPSAKIEGLFGRKLVKRLPKTKKNTVRLFRGRGCSLCQRTGYYGRVGIFEILEMTENIKKLIMEKVPASRIKEEAHKAGMSTMVEDGIAKVEIGVTTIEEILRVAK